MGGWVGGWERRAYHVVELGVPEFVGNALLDVPMAINLVFVREEEVAVHLVDKHLKADAGVDGMGPRHHIHQPHQGVLVRLVLRVEDVDERGALPEHYLFAQGFPPPQHVAPEGEVA